MYLVLSVYLVLSSKVSHKDLQLSRFLYFTTFSCKIKNSHGHHDNVPEARGLQSPEKVLLMDRNDEAVRSM